MRKRVAFVCIGNSCRSQMAEGFARHYGSEVLEAYSAGTHPTKEVNAKAIEVMREKGIDITTHRPKLLDEIPMPIDILITMGCGVECPYVPNNYKEDWGLEDPVGKPLDEFRKTRDIIETKVKELVEKVKNGLD